MSKKSSFIFLSLSIFFIGVGSGAATIAHAQVVVTPSQVPDNSRQTFTVNVPSARQYSTTALKLFLPQELSDIVPDVKPGWRVALKNKLTSSTTTPTEIDWTGGAIPTGEGDTFQFSADVPIGSLTLVWRAYQTYSDGVVISWDQADLPTTPVGATSTKIFFGHSSETLVVGNESVADAFTDPSSFGGGSGTAIDLSIISLILSGMAVFIAWRSRLR